MRPADVMAITKSSIGTPRGITTYWCSSLYPVPQRAARSCPKLASSPTWPYFFSAADRRDGLLRDGPTCGFWLGCVPLG